MAHAAAGCQWERLGVFRQPFPAVRCYVSDVRIPVWLTLGVAAIVIVFGVYRIRISFRTDDQDQRAKERGGLYAMGRRTHLIIGVLYILLGGALIATSFGWNPFGTLFGPDTETPTKDKAPTRSGVPIDQLPTRK